MKVLFIGYYELKEHLKHIKKNFIKYNYEVINYPLFQYAYDSNDKLENYEEHLINFIEDNNIDIILWWFLDVPIKVFKAVKKNHPNIYYILFNTDDPNNVHIIAPKCEIFDLIMTPCYDCIKIYREHNNKATILWNPCGYDPKYYFPIQENEFNCDVSIICYDLLTDPYFSNQTVNRKILIDTILKYCNNNNKIFNIYGSYALKEVYPDNYISDVSYIDANKIINNSRINICTHAFNNYELAVTDLEFKILGSGGLLFMDSTEKIQEIFINGKNCILYTKDNYISKINNILNNYKLYTEIKENGHNFSKLYTWQKFVEKIHIEISKKYFDPDYYKKIYSLNLDNQQLLNYWLNTGLNLNHICCKLKIPLVFDYNSYSTDNLIDLDQDIAYHHWFTNGKKKKYLIKNVTPIINNFMDIKSFNTNVEQIFELYSCFNDLYNTSSTKLPHVLEKIANIYSNNPKLKVNDALQLYRDMIY